MDIKKFYNKYKEANIQDVIKFMFQREFGCAHAVSNYDNALNYLLSETKSIINDGYLYVTLEDLGNETVRIHLNNDGDYKVKSGTIAKLFYLSSNVEKGDQDKFIDDLKSLELDIDSKNFVDEYIKGGVKAVHHSNQYKNAYLPSYRVVEKSYANFIEVFSKIDSLPDEAVVTIEGNSGSGKSTLSKILNEIYGCDVIKMDDFFLQTHQRTDDRLSEVGGNIDYERFNEEVVSKIQTTFNYQKYNCMITELTEFKEITSKLKIVEGVYSNHPKFNKYYDLSIFLNIEREMQYKRILKRSGEFMFKRFKDEWIPKEDSYFEKFKISNNCDIIIKV